MCLTKGSKQCLEDKDVSEYLGEPHVENMIKEFLQLKKRCGQVLVRMYCLLEAWNDVEAPYIINMSLRGC